MSSDRVSPRTTMLNGVKSDVPYARLISTLVSASVDAES